MPGELWIRRKGGEAMIKALNRELATLDLALLEQAEERMEAVKATIPTFSTTLPSASFEASTNVWFEIVVILTEVIRFSRKEFVTKKDTVKLPTALNIIKWIRVAIFFIRIVKRICEAIRKR